MHRHFARRDLERIFDFRRDGIAARLNGYLADEMALIWTTDQRETKVEISAARVEEECHKVAASRFPVVELKLSGRDEMIRINAEHIVSIKNHVDDVPDD